MAIPACLDSPQELRELRTIDVLLVRSYRSDTAKIFLGEMISWSAGRRGYVAAGRDWLAHRDFRSALACLRQIEEGKDRDDFDVELERAVQEWQTGCQEDVSRLAAEERRLLQDGGDSSDLAEARKCLQAVRGVLGLLSESGAVRRRALEDLGSVETQKVREDLEYAALAIEEAGKDLARRQEADWAALRDLKLRADTVIGEILGRSDFREVEQGQALRLHGELLKAFGRRDRIRAEAYRNRLDRLLCHEPDLTDDEDTPMAKAAAVALPSGTRAAITGGPFRVEQLSPISRLDLEASSATVPAAVETSPAFPSWEWQRDRLLGRKAWARAERVQPGSDAALGEFLVALAKIQLMEGEAERARFVFADAFRWACHSAGAADQGYEDTAVLGMLLAWALPSLPPKGRSEATLVSNLEAIFQRRIGVFPFGLLAQHGLMSQLGDLVLGLGRPYSNRFLDRYLLAYLAEHPVAAQDFLAGVLGEAFEQPGASVDLVATVLPGLPPERPRIDALLRSLRSEVEGLKPGTDRQRVLGVLKRLRECFLQSAEEDDLAVAAAAGIDGAIRRANEWSEQPSLTHRLLTKDVELVVGRAREERLVVELSYRQGPQALRNLRTEVQLLDAKGQPIEGALEAPPTVLRVMPGERRELPIALVGAEEDLLRGVRLQVRHGTLGASGVLKHLETSIETFAVAIRKVGGRPVAPPNNPYVVGVAVTVLEQIFGRQDEVTRIVRALIGEHQDNAVLVLGDRRIGKTTLLNAVKLDSTVQERYLTQPIVDLQNLAVNESTAAFFRGRLVERVRLTLEEARIASPPIQERRFQENPHQGVADYFDAVDRSLARHDRRLLVILDEVEALLKVVEQHPEPGDGTLGKAVVATLRSIILSSRRISFVLSGVTDVLRRHTVGVEDRLFKLAVEIELSVLPAKAARQLVEEPARGQYQLTRPAAELIVEETSGHPYLLQQVCRELFEEMVRRRVRVVTVTDVEEVLSTRIVPHRAAFSYLSEAFQESVEYAIIKALAVLHAPGRFSSLWDLHRQLARAGTEISRDDLGDRFRRLAERATSVLELDVPGGEHARLRVGLFARHLRQLQEDRQAFVLRRR